MQPWESLPPFSCVSTYSAPFNAGYSVQHDNVAQQKYIKQACTSCKLTFIERNFYGITQDL